MGFTTVMEAVVFHVRVCRCVQRAMRLGRWKNLDNCGANRKWEAVGTCQVNSMQGILACLSFPHLQPSAQPPSIPSTSGYTGGHPLELHSRDLALWMSCVMKCWLQPGTPRPARLWASSLSCLGSLPCVIEALELNPSVIFLSPETVKCPDFFRLVERGGMLCNYSGDLQLLGRGRAEDLLPQLAAALSV